MYIGNLDTTQQLQEIYEGIVRQQRYLQHIAISKILTKTRAAANNIALLISLTCLTIGAIVDNFSAERNRSRQQKKNSEHIQKK